MEPFEPRRYVKNGRAPRVVTTIGQAVALEFDGWTQVFPEPEVEAVEPVKAPVEGEALEALEALQAKAPVPSPPAKGGKNRG